MQLSTTPWLVFTRWIILCSLHCCFIFMLMLPQPSFNDWQNLNALIGWLLKLIFKIWVKVCKLHAAIWVLHGLHLHNRFSDRNQLIFTVHSNLMVSVSYLNCNTFKCGVNEAFIPASRIWEQCSSPRLSSPLTSLFPKQQQKGIESIISCQALGTSGVLW